jgi:hypothetical protein
MPPNLYTRSYTVTYKTPYLDRYRHTMGEAKRRKEQLGDRYGQVSNNKKSTNSASVGTDFVKWTTRGAWLGIGLLVAGWATIRWIGPSFGWWTISN